MRLIKDVGAWLEARLQLATQIRNTMEHPVPRQTASWAYVFGSAALTVFLLQLVTGILLALVYVPSAGEAWNSLQTLNEHITLGWFIRALHGWGSNFMIAIVLIHMVQVILFGAYKFPRELTWIIGVLLLLLTLGMAFTGQVLRFDQDAYWGLGIGASISRAVDREPLVGRTDHSGCHALALLRLARIRDPGRADCICRAASSPCAQARNQRMAHAGPHRSPRDLHAGISRPDAKGRRPLRSRSDCEGHVFLCFHPYGNRRLRGVFRSLRTERATRPHHHPDSTPPGLLLFMVVRRPIPAAAIDRKSV